MVIDTEFILLVISTFSIILLMGIANIIGTQYLLPTKRQKEFTLSVLAGVVVNFILNYIFIHLWQSIGACIATVISQLVVDLMLLLIVI